MLLPLSIERNVPMNPFSPKARAFRQRFFLALFPVWFYFIFRFILIGKDFGYFGGSEHRTYVAMGCIAGALVLLVLWILPDVARYMWHCISKNKYTFAGWYDAEEAAKFMPQVTPGIPCLVGIAICVSLELVSLLVKLIP
ncbi:MAG: hypothetical protein WAU88_10880 [Candidatus Zixiibacteriota bacterium]